MLKKNNNVLRFRGFTCFSSKYHTSTFKTDRVGLFSYSVVVWGGHKLRWIQERITLSHHWNKKNMGSYFPTSHLHVVEQNQGWAQGRQLRKQWYTLNISWANSYHPLWCIWKLKFAFLFFNPLTPFLSLSLWYTKRVFTSYMNFHQDWTTCTDFWTRQQEPKSLYM